MIEYSYLINNLLNVDLQRNEGAKNQKSPEEEEEDGGTTALHPVNLDYNNSKNLRMKRRQGERKIQEEAGGEGEVRVY